MSVTIFSLITHVPYYYYYYHQPFTSVQGQYHLMSVTLIRLIINLPYYYHYYHQPFTSVQGLPRGWQLCLLELYTNDHPIIHNSRTEILSAIYDIQVQQLHEQRL